MGRANELWLFLAFRLDCMLALHLAARADSADTGTAFRRGMAFPMRWRGPGSTGWRESLHSRPPNQ